MADHAVRRPEFITFTGIDDRTDVGQLVDLHSAYPIEWGVLFSCSRAGREPRYPGHAIVSRLNNADGGLRIAAHLCGHYARAANGQNRFVPGALAPLWMCDRVQVNLDNPDPAAVARFALVPVRGSAICQTRRAFPDDTAVDWLYDPSGGRGIAPNDWPAHPGGDRLVGYAGGITPDNVTQVIAAIAATGPYWIDMESGVRTDDWLDLAKCRAVCEAVYD